MPSITTKQGDQGSTALLYGRRISKSHPRVEAYGTVDEWSAFLGQARCALAGHPVLAGYVHRLQTRLIGLMGELAVDDNDRERFLESKLQRLVAQDLEEVESWLAELEKRVPQMAGWSVPGDDPVSVTLEVARTVVRRLERQLVRLSESGASLPPLALPWLNRCSDLLWLMARVVEQDRPAI